MGDEQYGSEAMKLRLREDLKTAMIRRYLD